MPGNSIYRISVEVQDYQELELTGPAISVAADLLDYRLDERGLHPALWFPPVGRSCIVITCEVPRRALLPEEFFPDIEDLEPNPACTTCGSRAPGAVLGLPFCPNDFHYPPEAAWRRILGYTVAIAVAGVWLLALFLYIAGVIN